MPLRHDRKTIAYAREMKTALAARLYGRAAAGTSYLASVPPESGICGFGYGSKRTGNSIGADEAVLVYVRRKLPKARVRGAHLIPDEIEGIPTDVIAVGEVRALGPRPVPCGDSVSRVAGVSGTLGCLVEDGGGQRFILSNNHVLAGVNAGTSGDDILEPAATQGGDAFPPIGHLSDFEPLHFGAVMNVMDAAIASVNAADVLPEIDTIGRVSGKPLAPLQHMAVMKHGSTTGKTRGMISDIAADTAVLFGARIAHFQSQIGITNVDVPFGDGGDSGALVVEATSLRPIGLLFSAGPTRSFCCPIQPVLKRFGVTIV
jgi:hypothetical protein